MKRVSKRVQGDAKNKPDVAGKVSHVFAHRFVVKTADGAILADLGGKDEHEVTLKKGDAVQLWGVQKKSELKVHCLAIGGKDAFDLPRAKQNGHHGKGDGHHIAVEHNPDVALKVVKKEGYKPVGVPRRKHKHFEILGLSGKGDLAELHVRFDGTLRKTKPVKEGDPKWAAERDQGAES